MPPCEILGCPLLAAYVWTWEWMSDDVMVVVTVEMCVAHTAERRHRLTYLTEDDALTIRSLVSHAAPAE